MKVGPTLVLNQDNKLGKCVLKTSNTKALEVTIVIRIFLSSICFEVSASFYLNQRYHVVYQCTVCAKVCCKTVSLNI